MTIIQKSRALRSCHDQEKGPSQQPVVLPHHHDHGQVVVSKEIITRRVKHMFILMGALVTFYSQVMRPFSSSGVLSLEVAEGTQRKKSLNNNRNRYSPRHPIDSSSSSSATNDKTLEETPSSSVAAATTMTLEELRDHNNKQHTPYRKDYDGSITRRKKKKKGRHNKEMKREKHQRAAKNKRGRTTSSNNTTTTTGVSSGRRYRYSTKYDNKNSNGNNLTNYKEVERIKALYTNHSSRYCLTNECIYDIAKREELARAFPDRNNNKEAWCIPKGMLNNNNNNTTTGGGKSSNKSSKHYHRKHKGLILVKVPKAASSTSAGVVLRLGHRNGCDVPNYVHWGHQHAHKQYAHRDRQQSFMITSIRHPASQLVSNVFWTFITLRQIPQAVVTEDFVTKRAMTFATNLGMVKHYQGGLQLQFASLTKIPYNSGWDYETHDLINPQGTIAFVKAIMEGYDFMLVVERMDESLVALALILGVPVTDVVVTSSKVSTTNTATKPKEGGEGGGGPHNSSTTTGTPDKRKQKQQPYVYSYRARDCLPVRSTFVPPLLDGYLKSDFFRSQAYGDLLLSAAANLSLDKTIERLGVQRFQEAMKEYTYWKQKEKEECADKIEFPCSSYAEPQLEKAQRNCYDGDIGCGYKCFDKIVDQGKNR